jgi:hypothetical protein
VGVGKIGDVGTEGFRWWDHTIHYISCLALPQITSSTHNMGPDDSKRLTNQSTPTRLLDLPPEAILCIADFLPVHSAASLAFCNHKLKSATRSAVLEPLRQHNHGARITLLSALAKDLPGYFVRHICSLLHLSSRVLPPRPTESGLFQNPLRCVRNDASLNHRMPRSSYTEIRPRTVGYEATPLWP